MGIPRVIGHTSESDGAALLIAGNLGHFGGDGKPRAPHAHGRPPACVLHTPNDRPGDSKVRVQTTNPRSCMKLLKALELNRKHVHGSATPHRIVLACGFTPLHLATFLEAHMRRAVPGRLESLRDDPDPVSEPGDVEIAGGELAERCRPLHHRIGGSVVG